MIFEFFAVSSERLEEPAATASQPMMVGDLSVNSHVVGELLDAISQTLMQGLVGDGSDAHRTLVLSPANLAVLATQIAPWAIGSSEVLVDAQIAFEDAIAEAIWLKQSLLIIVT